MMGCLLKGRCKRSSLLQLCAVAMLTLMSSNKLSAHPVLVPVPTLTLADKVLLSETLALAREDLHRPFHYQVLTTIKGSSVNAPVELFMSSQVRRQLAMDKELKMLLAHNAANGRWQVLGLATNDFMQTVKRIIAFSDNWQPKESDNQQRIKFFTDLLGHDDLRLHELAYLEIGRATYASIRQTGMKIPIEKVRAMIDDPMYFAWRGLDVMLLGMSKEEQDEARVLKEMNATQKFSIEQDLAAWATAFVEVKGSEGLTQLTQWYFQDSSRTPEELRSVVRALAGHANENVAMQAPVIAAYEIMLDTHPHIAPEIVHDLISWKRWDLTEKLTQLKPIVARKDPLGVYQLNLYLQQARLHQGAPKA